jgi:hypothetical protein
VCTMYGLYESQYDVEFTLVWHAVQDAPSDNLSISWDVPSFKQDYGRNVPDGKGASPGAHAPQRLLPSMTCRPFLCSLAATAWMRCSKVLEFLLKPFILLPSRDPSPMQVQILRNRGIVIFGTVK